MDFTMAAKWLWVAYKAISESPFKPLSFPLFTSYTSPDELTMVLTDSQYSRYTFYWGERGAVLDKVHRGLKGGEEKVLYQREDKS